MENELKEFENNHGKPWKLTIIEEEAKAIELAKSQLPDPETFKDNIFRVPVIKSLICSLLNPNPFDNNCIIFDFIKRFDTVTNKHYWELHSVQD